jgi:hypothetical protein
MENPWTVCAFRVDQSARTSQSFGVVVVPKRRQKVGKHHVVNVPPLQTWPPLKVPKVGADRFRFRR